MREGSANDKALLDAVERRIGNQCFLESSSLSELNIEQAATFARVFAGNNTRGHSMYALRGLGETVQRYDRVSQANIQQIAATCGCIRHERR